VIIQILANLKEEGYLANGRHSTLAPFLAGANVAFRRRALEEIGGFDPKCMTAEDCDVCVRLAAAGWQLYLRHDAVVSHENPSRLTRLVRQWYGYGRYHPYVFAKHNDRALELYVRLRRPIDGQRYACAFYRMMLVTAAAWLAGAATVGWAGVALTLVFAASYAWPDLRRSGAFSGCAFAAIRYAADMALLLGALIGGVRQKMLYLSATVD
jgi:GT2 family glycosyltransferase